MSYTLILAVVLCLCTHFLSVLSGDKVKLTDAQLLTFRQGLNTTARRSHSVPQLNCRGGSAGCQHQPAVVECHNRGNDGRSIKWECQAEMNKSQKFGLIQVKCEGYDHPRDEYVLEGSCSLDYALEKTGCEDCSKDGASGQETPSGDHLTTRPLPSLVDVLHAIGIILAAIAVCVVCTWCCDIICPRKKGDYEFSGLMLLDKQGSRKMINFPSLTQRIQKIEVISLQRSNTRSRRN